MRKRVEANARPWAVLKPMLDLALCFGSFVLAYQVRYRLQWFREVEPAYHVPFSVYLPSALALTAILGVVLWVEGAYRRDRHPSLFDDLYIAARSVTLGVAAMIIVVFLATPSYYSRLILGYTGVISLGLVSLARVVERSVLVRRYRQGKGVHRVLIVGADEVGRSVMRVVVARPDLGYQIVGFVDDDPERSATDIGRYRALGTTDKLPEVLRQEAIDEVIIALPWGDPQKIMRIVHLCERQNTAVRIVPDLFQMTLSRVVIENLDGIALLSLREPALLGWQIALKRLIDVLVAGAGLLFLAPLFGVLAIAIKLDSPGPVIFRQTRLGRNGKPFTCFKFRSMYVDAEARLEALRAKNEASGPIFKMRDDPRRTRMGKFLRRTSMDELPQLWNVLKGEMSLVGPRPPIPSEVEAYEPWHCRRLEVRPGITGLWQVSGRSNLTFDEMVLLDIYYIENWSPTLDLRILLRTIPTVLFARGAY